MLCHSFAAHPVINSPLCNTDPFTTSPPTLSTLACRTRTPDHPHTQRSPPSTALAALAAAAADDDDDDDGLAAFAAHPPVSAVAAPLFAVAPATVLYPHPHAPLSQQLAQLLCCHSWHPFLRQLLLPGAAAVLIAVAAVAEAPAALVQQLVPILAEMHNVHA